MGAVYRRLATRSAARSGVQQSVGGRGAVRGARPGAGAARDRRRLRAALPGVPKPDAGGLERAARGGPARPDPRENAAGRERARRRGLHGGALRRLRALSPAPQAHYRPPVGRAPAAGDRRPGGAVPEPRAPPARLPLRALGRRAGARAAAPRRRRRHTLRLAPSGRGGPAAVTTFWIIAALLAIAALAFVLPSLLARTRRPGATSGEANVALYRD